jgi:hypothetical protein
MTRVPGFLTSGPASGLRAVATTNFSLRVGKSRSWTIARRFATRRAAGGTPPLGETDPIPGDDGRSLCPI